MATPTVTVLANSGTTVTIPFTSASNAAAAQRALNTISQAVMNGTLTQVNYSGGSTLPGAGTGVTTPAIGVLALSGSAVGLPGFGINNSGGIGLGVGDGYVSAVLGGAVEQGMLVGFGAQNTTVVSGSGGSTISGSTPTVVAGSTLSGAAIGNLGFNTQVFFGGAQQQNFVEYGASQLGSAFAGFSPSADVWFDMPAPLRSAATPAFPNGQAIKATSLGFADDSNGSTVIHIDTIASGVIGPEGNNVFLTYGQTLVLTNNGTGSTTVNLASNTSGLPGYGLVGALGTPSINGTEISFRGTSTVAATVNAAGGANALGAATGGTVFTALIQDGSAFINGGGSVVLMDQTGTGVATLFGGAGSDNTQITGLVVGGSHLDSTGAQSTVNGINFLASTSVVGASTLIGGGTGDQINLEGADQVAMTGLGNESLFAYQPGDLIMGTGVLTSIPGLTLPGANSNPLGSDLMVIYGGATVMSGSGSNTMVLSNNNGANLLQEGVIGDNTALVSNFVSGVDTISLAQPGSNTPYTLVESESPTTVPGQVDLAPGAISGSVVTFGDGTTWTFTSVVQGTDFH